MMKRQVMKPAAFCVNMMPMMPGQASIRMKAKALRAPNFSHRKPVIRRMPMVPATEAMADETMSDLTRSSDWGFLMYAMSGAAAKVEKKVQKKPMAADQKARMCGLAHEKSASVLKTAALCSASTGRMNSRPKMSVAPLVLMPRLLSASWRRSTCSSSAAILDFSSAMVCDVLRKQG